MVLLEVLAVSGDVGGQRSRLTGKKLLVRGFVVSGAMGLFWMPSVEVL